MDQELLLRNEYLVAENRILKAQINEGKNNLLLFPQVRTSRRADPVQCREQLGGLLRYYHREAA